MNSQYPDNNGSQSAYYEYSENEMKSGPESYDPKSSDEVEEISLKEYIKAKSKKLKQESKLKAKELKIKSKIWSQKIKEEAKRTGLEIKQAALEAKETMKQKRAEWKEREQERRHARMVRKNNRFEDSSRKNTQNPNINTKITKFCPLCGQQVTPGGKFCPNCGGNY